MTPPDQKNQTLTEPAARQPVAPSLLPAVPPLIDVGALLGEGREAVLVHNGETYRLRITASNKLILTK